MEEAIKELLNTKEKKPRAPRINIDKLKPIVLSIDNVLDKDLHEIAHNVLETYLTSLNISVTFILDAFARWPISFSYDLKSERNKYTHGVFHRSASNKENPVLFISSFNFNSRLHLISGCFKFSPTTDYSSFMISTFSGSDFDKQINSVKISGPRSASLDITDENKNLLHISKAQLMDILEERVKSSKISSDFFNHYSRIFQNSDIRMLDLFNLIYGLMIADLLGVQPSIHSSKNKAILNAQINRIKRNMLSASRPKRISKRDLKEIILEDVDFGVF